MTERTPFDVVHGPRTVHGQIATGFVVGVRLPDMDVLLFGATVDEVRAAAGRLGSDDKYRLVHLTMMFRNDPLSVDWVSPEDYTKLLAAWKGDTLAEARAVPEGWKLLKDTTHAERSWPEDSSHENGNYSNICVHCLRGFVGHKRRPSCKVCAATPSPAEQPKPAVRKAQRVHALVNAGPFPGMSEAFDAHMGAACWTEPEYAPDAAMWAAGWKAATARAALQGEPHD